ncbi:MKRN2 opposite strand protein isoform X2 [Gracilinanus agilis]|uniref:MKRN2 opposite strand protein isoform X2 n=1 Tax=Gracilinanus agilis TaxID=191870 RepID=UPI001CFF467E|nr:MKRN2 opposite strand protein isoform X2 [Gracilinanus agilis]
MQPPEAGRPVVQFRHCGKEVFGFRVPELCPVCRRPLSFGKLDEAPVSIATPLSSGHRERCAFLLRPTRGTFLSSSGIHRDEAGWEQSISIPLLQPNMFGLMDQWDKYLEEFSATDAWSPNRYDEHCHNCYTFALTFINYILTTEGKHQLDRDEFTEKFVVPRSRRASKYITLYRAIEEHGFYITDRLDSDTNLL